MHEVVLPKTGMYEDDVVLVEWIAKEGSWVGAGDPIFVIASEKVEMEIESHVGGWIHLEAEPGFEGPIGTRIGVISDSETGYRELVARP